MYLIAPRSVDFRKVYGNKPIYTLVEDLAKMMYSGSTPAEREAAMNSFPSLSVLDSSLAGMVAERVLVIGTRLLLQLRFNGSRLVAYICDIADEGAGGRTNQQ